MFLLDVLFFYYFSCSVFHLFNYQIRYIDCTFRRIIIIVNALFFYYLSYIAQETHETNIMVEEMYKREKR